jgi:protein TonB
LIGFSKTRWSAALTVALGLHLAIAAAWLRSPPQSGAVQVGEGGIAAALGPSGAAPGAVATHPPPEMRAVEPEETAEIDPDAPSDAPTPETAAMPLPEVPSSPEAESASQIEPPVAATAAPEVPGVDEIEPEVVAERMPAATPARPAEPPDQTPPPEPAEAEIAEAAPVEPEALLARTPAPTEQETPIAPPPKPRPPEHAETEPAEDQAAAALPGAGGEAGTKDVPDTGSGDDSAGGGAPGARADYLQALQVWLERHKVYPQNAIRRRQEGVVMLRFVMDREGRVIRHEISDSSGYRLLDLAVESLIERAQPLPALPPQMAGAELTLVVPINFTLE